ncbi:hypothetical protein [Streptomyces sp. CT34]|uniref:hypothetical protein n=1 Tax=Streptomyces sp. CT34 TaxID=1553907 RepID=UPI000B0DE9E9|nr:hypothetical protein [Streptomyces sp. CT34]
MGFGTYARRVRDERLPLARRYAALRCAVGHYCPLGFHATWAYLAAVARPSPELRRDPAALLRALDVLEAGRAVRLRETDAFAAVRRAEKAAGRRTPRAADTAHLRGPRWPGDTAPSRPGLVAAVADRHRAFRRLPVPDGARSGDDRARRAAELHRCLDGCAAAYLANLGRLDGPARDALARTVGGIRRLLRPGRVPTDVPLAAWLRLAELLAYAAEFGGAPNSGVQRPGADEGAEVGALKESAWREAAAIDTAPAAGEIDEAGWHGAIAGLVRPAYLAARTPWGQSGMSCGEADWVAARRFVLEAVERDGTFLDCGCANGYLMECLERWAAADGRRLELYGLDIIGELVAPARRRLPHRADGIWEGNALTWVPPRRFDVVRVGLEYVPVRRRPDLVRHLLDAAVAPGGRLVIGPYTEEAGTRATERDLAGWGFAVAGRAEVAHRDPRVVRRLVWIAADASGAGPGPIRP